MNRLFVIIVTYNGAKWIKKCLRSVYSSTVEATPIILDNGSTDDTLRIIRTEFPETEIVETHANLGFGKANNIGMRMAMERGADYIYLLNQDAWVEQDTFERLIAVHKANPEYGILSPIHLTGNGQNVDANFLRFTASYDKCRGIYPDLLMGKHKDIYETTFIMAAHWLLYVPNLKEVGLFSPAFPHYGEDANLVHRYRYRKKKIGICPSVFAYHDREYRKDSPQKQLYLDYIYVLTRYHDIFDGNGKTRCKALLHYMVCLLMRHGVSLKEKATNLSSVIRAIKESSKYREYYKNENCYNILSEKEAL